MRLVCRRPEHMQQQQAAVVAVQRVPDLAQAAVAQQMLLAQQLGGAPALLQGQGTGWQAAGSGKAPPLARALSVVL